MKSDLKFRKLKKGGLRILIRDDLYRPDVLKQIKKPDRLLEKAKVLYKDSAKTTAGIVSICGQPFFLKRYNRRGIFHTARTVLRRSRPKKVIAVSTHLTKKGVLTPEPVALMEKRKGRLLLSSYILTRCVKADRLRYQIEKRKNDPEWTNRAIKNLAALIASIHKAKVMHGDMKANNFIIEKPYEKARIWVVDLDGSVIKRRIDIQDQARDLARLFFSFRDTLCPLSHLRFFVHYIKEMHIKNLAKEELYALLTEIHEISNNHLDRRN